MFRRSKTAEPVTTVPVKEGGKGRPTPSRREAEAARKARAKGPTDKKEAAKLNRAKRAEANAKMREGMKTGDDRYLPVRDKGPVRRCVRDLVDSRLCMAELLLPLLLLIMVTQSFATQLSSSLWSITLLLVVADTAFLVFKLRREMARRFGGQDGRDARDTKGAVGYGVLRSLQLRWLRMPKAQVRLGAKLPERY